ncbi:MAG: glutamyl-tRNA reductase [Lachnospiraceae bacterium]|nr:glutamyl-tRNA reductase [Lachnospiraceae bacterium]
MGIQLLCISHKSAPAGIRSKFAFDEDKQLNILKLLTDTPETEEAVVISTCGRTEIYCSGNEPRKIFSYIQDILVKMSGMGDSEISDYILRFQDKSAMHHLFMVAAGLDSEVLGEDQILGQVKDAYNTARENGYCHSLFNAMFQTAIAAAKRVKTDTMLSKSSVSTASLAVKQSVNSFGSLKDKNVMIIGASGSIGNIVLRDMLSISGVNVYATVRHTVPAIGVYQSELIRDKARNISYDTIPYHDRYEWIDRMDVIISATSSPHYTITAARFKDAVHTVKKRVFFDLAVPFDIEQAISDIEYCECYSMEDIERLARHNNSMKINSVPEAREILSEYEDKFIKDHLYAQNMELFGRFKENVSSAYKEGKGDRYVDSFLATVKKESSASEYETFVKIFHKFSERI